MCSRLPHYLDKNIVNSSNEEVFSIILPIEILQSPGVIGRKVKLEILQLICLNKPSLTLIRYYFLDFILHTPRRILILNSLFLSYLFHFTFILLISYRHRAPNTFVSLLIQLSILCAYIETYGFFSLPL